MDEETLQAMSAIWVDISPEWSKPPIPTQEEVIKVVDWIINNPDIQDTSVVETQDNIIPEDKIKEGEEPQIINDETHKDIIPDEPEINTDESDLDEVLKSLEEMSKESLDNIKKTSTEIEKKIKKVNSQEEWSIEQSKTVKEIVDLNVKLQQELSIIKMTDKAKDNKIQELNEKVNSLQLDDSREEVPDELRVVNNYLKKFKGTNNETFKIKAISEAVDFIENLTGKPLKGAYLDDYIEDNLKVIERMTQKSHDEIARENEHNSDPKADWARIHWVDI